MATNYARGAAFERKVARDLECHGYVWVRSAGSHSPADILALRVGETLAVQCKLNGRLDPEEWNELWEFAIAAGAKPVAAMPHKVKGRTDIIYYRLAGRKDGRGRQPWEPWTPQIGGY